MATSALQKTLTATNVLRCLDCGKCTAVCPISRNNGSYSPRRIVGRTVFDDPSNVAMDPIVWTCLSCGLCSERCPSDVRYDTLTRDLRAEAYRLGNRPECSHGGALQASMRIMAGSDHPQDRMGWVTDDLKIAEKGEFGYFVGCLPYFDALFSDMDANTLEIARSTVRVLNAIGIEPVLFKDERCCGHDLLWGGDTESFKQLAERNVVLIRESGVKTVLTACPECYRSLAVDYPAAIGPLGFNVQYVTEFLMDYRELLAAGLGEYPGTVSYQDPCRLGRHMGITESPRDVLEAIPALTLKEMPKRGRGAICCGTSAWQSCDAVSKRIQMSRLQSAHKAGAETMVTSCPKCLVHFTCAMQGESIPENEKITVKDLMVVLAESLAAH